MTGYQVTNTTGIEDEDNSLDTVATLAGLPAGNYLLSATLSAKDNYPSDYPRMQLVCHLTADSDHDAEEQAPAGNTWLNYSLQLAHHFTANGVATVSCYNVYNYSDTLIQHIVIRAVPVATLVTSTG